MAKVKKFRWEIDEENDDQGVFTISLVDSPAMESNFIAFSKQEIKPKFVKFEVEGYKQVVAGLALIPDKEIPRVDPTTGEEYVGYFDAETIEKIRNKFHKEQQTQNVNTDHEEDEQVDAYLIESYIVTSDKQIEDLSDKGIDEATIGSWFVSYKIEDEETFQKVLEGEYNGFSVELYADRILESFNYNYNLKNKFSMKNFIEKLKSLLNEFETDEPKTEETEVKLERAAVPALEIIVEWGEIGEPVSSVISDENGEETLEVLEDGEYELEDSRILVITDGVLSEIKDAPAEEAPEEEAPAEEPTDEVDAEEVEVKSAKETLAELGVDFSQDGYWMIEVGVEGGEPVWGSIMANTYKDLKFKLEGWDSKLAEIADLQKTIDELNLKIKEPITEPQLGHGEEIEDDVDLSKLSNYERIARKNKLPIV